jgi:hypothetical protein
MTDFQRLVDEFETAICWEEHPLKSGADSSAYDIARTALLSSHAALAARCAALESELKDMAEHGLRFDLNPCHDMTDQNTSERFWHSYARRMDEAARDRARAALKGTP